jgi:hypothetical protein
VGGQAAAQAAAVGIMTALTAVGIFFVVVIVIVIVLKKTYIIAFETKRIFACFPSKTKKMKPKSYKNSGEPPRRIHILRLKIMCLRVSY